MPRSWRSKLSIQTYILLLTVVISATVLAVTYKVATLSAIQAVETQTGEQTNTTARILSEYLRRSPALRVPPDFESHVREVLEFDPHVIRVDVYADFDGQVKLVESSSLSGDRPIEGQEMAVFRNKRADTFVVEEGSKRWIFSVQPVQFQDGQQGFVSVVSSLEAADAILTAYSRIRLYATLVNTVLLVIALTLLFRKTVYVSVRHLVDVMHRFKQREFSARADDNLVGEFGELAAHFNLMMGEIQAFDERMQQRIEAATDELARRNDELQSLNIQLYETQKRLSQAERLALAGELTATFAHEIGSPLSAISTHLQLLLEDSGLSPEIRDRLLLANEQIDRVCSIVESLLATTRQARRRARIDLREIIGKVVRLLSPTMASRQIRFELEGPDRLAPIEGDPDQLQQLFLNLFNNSLDAIREPGTLSVAIQYPTPVGPTGNGTRGYIQVDIKDTGVGISPDKLNHIFNPLFTTKEFGKGTGLGLAVSQWIVRRHGGRISVASAPGEGACFTIFLPEAQETNADGADAAMVKEAHPQ